LSGLPIAEKTLQEFVKSFNEDTPFWDLSKQRALGENNLDLFRKQLKILDSHDFTDHWDEVTQRQYSKALYGKGLIEFFKMDRIMKEEKKRLIDADTPQEFFEIIDDIYSAYVSGMGSSPANARIIASLANKLGFLYEQKHSLVFTEVGRAFVKSRNVSEMIRVVSTQLEKWLFWNPDVRAADREHIELFPFRFTVKVADAVSPKKLTTDEMALFVMTATRMSQVSERAKLIQEFMRLSGKNLSTLLKSVDLGKLRGFVSYIFSAFTTAKAFARGTGTIMLKNSSDQVRRILIDDFPYFRYHTDDENLRLYNEYYGSASVKQPHRNVALSVSDDGGNAVQFAHARINDSPTRYSLIRKGKANIVLPNDNTSVDILSFSTGKETILASASIPPDESKVVIQTTGKTTIEKRDFDTCLRRLELFVSSDEYDPELSALVHLKEKDTNEEEDLKQARGGRFEQLVWELLQSMTPAYFDSAEWEGELDEDYGIPRHAPGLTNDITIRKADDMLILEVTLAGVTQQQGKDLSVQSHLTKERPHVKGILVGIFVITKGFYRQVLENFANDRTNVVCPMTLDEFLKILGSYWRGKDYATFIKQILGFRGRS